LYRGLTRRSEHVTTTITILLVLFGLFVFFLMYRNVRVYQFRTMLFEQIIAISRQEVHQDPFTNWYWRYTYYNTVSYDQMMYRFWVPLKVNRWYKEDAFLR